MVMTKVAGLPWPGTLISWAQLHFIVYLIEGWMYRYGKTATMEHINK